MSGEEIVEIESLTLLPNPFQVRDPCDGSDLKLGDLVESIRKSGVIELPVVRETEKGYQIAAGHRRVAACIKLGMKTIKCILRRLTDEQMAEIILEENLKRYSLNPIEEARGYANLRGLHRSEEWIADRFGVTRDIVAQRLRLLTFPRPIQDLVAKGQLTTSHAEAISMAPLNSQVDFAKTVLEKALNVKETTEEAKRLLDREKLNQSALGNIGPIMVDIQQRLVGFEYRIAAAESSLTWFELLSQPWKSERCRHNLNGFCHRFSWNQRPSFWMQRIRKVAKVKELEDGAWHIQACPPVCAHCNLFEERESTPNVQPVS